MVILVDTREQKNEHILKYFDVKGIKHVSKSLKYGDYSFMIPKSDEFGIPRDLFFYNHIVVERKGSLEEISGNFTEGRDRFEKELSLAPKNKVIMIENAGYSDVCFHNYQTQYNEKALWASLHTMWWKYGCPTFFVDKNSCSGAFIEGFFDYYLKTLVK